MTDDTTENENDRSSKKRRRRSVYGVCKNYDLHTLMGSGWATFTGEFRENVRRFVTEHANVEKSVTMGMPTWRSVIVDEESNVVVPVFTVEESVIDSDKSSCDYCRCHGWSSQFVSEKRYHVIIPADDEWNMPLNSNALKSTTHLLHGLIHCNGFGHLLLINGREGGSKFIFGRKLMDLWDHLCTSLRAREVSVEDVSIKYSLDLRLLFGIAYGTSWFSHWDYYLHSDNFGINKQSYRQAIGNLSTITLLSLLNEVTDDRNEINHIITKYCKRMNTVRDLLRRLIGLNSKPSQSLRTPPMRTKKQKAEKRKCHNFASVAASLGSRWPESRLITAARVIVDTLNTRAANMTRQQVRDAARLSIGDTGLIDFVLKSMDNTIVDGYVVHRITSNKQLEFRTTEHSSEEVAADVKTEESHEADAISQERKDLQTVCRCICLIRPLETQLLLSAKHWVKKFSSRDENVELSVDLFLRRNFLQSCEVHKWMSKSELNRYCVQCDLCLCSRCVREDVEHRCHRLIQIARYGTQAAVNVKYLQKLVDCTNIQTYTSTGAHAQVLLLEPQNRSPTLNAPLGSTPCKTCNHAISVPNHYCSIHCKVFNESSDQALKVHMIPHDANGALVASSSRSSPSEQSRLAEDHSNRQMDKSTDVILSMRVRSRKGRPRRSPFF